jgi:hypothetical protein
MRALKSKVTVEFSKIPEVMFQKSIMNMNRGGPSALIMAWVKGQHFEGRRQALEEYSNEMCDALRKLQTSEKDLHLYVIVLPVYYEIYLSILKF